MAKFVIIIPARYASQRFPGKPLALLQHKPMVQHVYERCKAAADHVYVATDDERIANAVKAFGGKWVITNPDHPSGTDRCAEAAEIIRKEIDFDVVINVQGDEPFVSEQQLSQLIDCFRDENVQIATLVCPIENAEVLFNANKVKAVVSASNQALYFSRQALPYLRDTDPEKWLENHPYYLHLGMYAFRAKVLQQLVALPPSALENAEKLEQLRWLENGFPIKVALTQHASIGVDTPEDLAILLRALNS